MSRSSLVDRLRSKRQLFFTLSALVGLAAATFSRARATNFRGYDEWVNVSLLSQGILEFPYANRPLNLIWSLPAWALFPDRLTGFLVFHVAWIALGGVVVFLIARRLLGGATLFAFLAGAFTIVWAPSDRSRLCTVQMILYSGCTFGALLAAWLMLEAWSRRKLVLAAAAVVAGAAAVMSFEATLAPLGLVPLLFLASGGTRAPHRLALWTLATFAFLAAGGLRAALPRWTDPERVAYQTGTGPDFAPGPLAVRTLKQLRRHIAPVVEYPPTVGAWPIVPMALAVFAVGVVVAARRPEAEARHAARPSPGALLVAAGFGLLWAIASYLPFVLNPDTHGGERMQFLSGPGVGVLLAAAAVGAASLVPPRGRPFVAGLLGAWVVAGGVMRTAALQTEWWDRKTAYPDQRRSLLELTAVVPDVAPGTLLIVVGSGTWPLDVTFHHAVRYLYEGRGVGHAIDALEYLYGLRFDASGAQSIPRPVLHRSWRELPTRHAYAAIVAVRENENGRVHLLETWPAELPALPPGATYAPRARIRFGPRLPRLKILER